MIASGKRCFLLITLVLIGLNLRPLLTSIGPLLPEIRLATGMSFSTAALLTTLPVLMMGVLALANGWLSRLWGERTAISLSLLAIVLGALIREFPPSASLLLGSALLGGLGIGVIQAVIPSVIKRNFTHRMPMVTGLWAAALMGGGGLGAWLTPEISHFSTQWHSALAWWALPAILALLCWWSIGRHISLPVIASQPRSLKWVSSPRAWLLGVYFGLINGGYMSLIAWLPPFYIQLGWLPGASGILLALMTVGQVFGALFLPLFIRGSDRRPLLLLTLLLQLIGFGGFLLAPTLFPVAWALACGIGLGGAFPLCLILALDHHKEPLLAGRLVAFMQGIGFLLAGATPYFSGVLRDLTGSYQAGWLLHGVLVIILIGLTLRFNPRSYIDKIERRRA